MCPDCSPPSRLPAPRISRSFIAIAMPPPRSECCASVATRAWAVAASGLSAAPGAAAGGLRGRVGLRLVGRLGGRVLGRVEEVGLGLLGRAAHPSPELVELGEP